jgi:hypothetical protein
MSNNPTLADSLIRSSFRKNYELIDPKRELPKLIAQANRFVLDDDMSAFMADLAWASLLTCKNSDKASILLNSLRKLARAPHKVTWIEYNHRARQHRAEQEYGSKSTSPTETGPDKCGWLILQHPHIETAFWALECASHTWGKSNERIDNPQAFILAHVWSSEDHPIPWNLITSQGNIAPEGVTTGVLSYTSPYAGVTTGFLPPKYLSAVFNKSPLNPLEELGGDLRYLWALLATINDLPVTTSEVAASKGFFAKGKYRKFLDHRTIRLTVPTKQYRRIAARAVVAVRKRAHQVRGHWRKDWRHPGQQLWIREHQRGDASLGFVVHSYEVTKNDQSE